jgi:imidazolonepropionase-like amidohydrolase
MVAEAADSGEAIGARRDSLTVAFRTVRLDRWRQEVTGGEKWLSYMYENFLVRPVVLSAVQRARIRRGALSAGTTAITDVNVVPMTRDTVLRGTTVLVVDGRVAAIGNDVAIPRGARRVDGRGKYLIPGLAVVHSHLYSDDALADSLAPAELGVMLANGITSARLMIGTPEQLALRRRVRSGEVLGPQLWVASPQLAGKQYPNGLVASTPDEARAAVRTVADAGYDFVKLTLGITPEVYDAIVNEAAQRRLRVVGHVEPEVGVERALKAGQQLEHLDAYFEAVLADDAPMKRSLTQYGVFDTTRWASLDHMDDVKIRAIAGATARAGVFTSPTLNVFNRAFAAREADDVIRNRPDWRLMPPATRDGYLKARERYWSDANLRARTDARRARYVEVRNALVKAIHDSGGKIIAGSDTPEWFHAYGFGLHRELQAYVEAGLTPYQALATATRNPAEFFFHADEWGTIVPGNRADLVLLTANPLEDIANTTKIDAVIVGGRLLPRAELDRMLLAGERAVAGAP